MITVVDFALWHTVTWFLGAAIFQ